MAGEEQQRRRLLGRLRRHLAQRRSPRATLSGIMMATAVAGFCASVGMLKLGLLAMWLRYPLAVLLAWGVFLLLVRLWAEKEREAIRVDEELAGLGPKDELASDERHPVSQHRERGARTPRWYDWLNPFDLLELVPLELEGCLVLGVIVILITATVGAVIAVGGLIFQAEALLAEVLLDTVLVSALYHRLRKREPDWWLHGALRHTAWPVLATIASLLILALFFQHYAPEAHSIGGVWRHWHPTPPR